MNSLKNHVYSMFSKYKENKQTKELKYEVSTNLEAKVDDLTANGMEYNEAINKAKESIKGIDYHRKVQKSLLINAQRQERNYYDKE